MTATNLDVLHAGFFSDWRGKEYACSCGWAGSSSELEMEPVDESVQLSCPTCQRHLVLVAYPTGEDIEKAAAEGNERALQMLARESGAS